MQIILVSRARKLPKTLDLGDRRLRWKLLSMVSVAVLGIMGAGMALALLVASPHDRALAQIQELQQQIQQQTTQQAQPNGQQQQGQQGTLANQQIPPVQ